MTRISGGSTGLARAALVLLVAAVLISAGILVASRGEYTTTSTTLELSTTTQSVTQTETEIITQTVTESVGGSATSALASSSAQSSCTGCGQSVSDVSISYGSPTISYGHVSFDGLSTTFLASEVVPLTITSPSPVEVDLTAQEVPPNVWVHFSPAQVTSSPGGSRANMTVSGIDEYDGPLSNETMLVGVTFGDASVLSPFVFVRSLNISVLSSSSSPLVFPQVIVAPQDGEMASPIGVVYDPADSTSASSFVVGLSVEGLIASNGTIVPLPAYMHVLLSNTSLSLAPERPAFLMVLVNTTSTAQDGTYKVAIAETLSGGQDVIQPLEVIIETQMQGSMGSMGSMGM